MTFLDDDRPKKQPVHDIGCDITFLSADELTARIELLQLEIKRLEEDRVKKSAGRLAAENLFR
jgi:uncharacterized small protein (DUF1192 family)